MVYMPVIKLLPEWFSERRGLAGGIIFSGTGVGGFVFPFVLNALLEKVGLRWTLRILAMGTSSCSAIALLCMRSRFPVPKYNATQRRPKLIPPHLSWLRSPLFISFVSHHLVHVRRHARNISLTRRSHTSQIVTNLLQGLSQFPVALYIAMFTRSISDQFTATVILALFNASAVVGQVLLGHLTDRFPYPSIMFVSAIGSALSAFLLWGFANAAIYLYFFAVIFGTLVRDFPWLALPLCLDVSRLSLSRSSRTLGRWVLLDMAECGGRVYRQPARVRRHGLRRDVGLQRYLRRDRSGHFWFSPRSRQRQLNGRWIRALRLWRSRALRWLLRACDRRRKSGSWYGETASSFVTYSRECTLRPVVEL